MSATRKLSNTQNGSTAKVYAETRRQVTRLSRSRSKSNSKPVKPVSVPKTNGTASKKSLGLSKPKQYTIDNRESMFNATNITLDNYTIKQTDNPSAHKKEADKQKYVPGRQTLKSGSSIGKNLGAGDRKSKGRSSACSFDS